MALAQGWKWCSPSFPFLICPACSTLRSLNNCDVPCHSLKILQHGFHCPRDPSTLLTNRSPLLFSQNSPLFHIFTQNFIIFILPIFPLLAIIWVHLHHHFLPSHLQFYKNSIISLLSVLILQLGLHCNRVKLYDWKHLFGGKYYFSWFLWRGFWKTD